MSKFNSNLNPLLPQSLLDLLPDLGYASFTPIQEQSLPTMIERQDLLAQAQTGSGKTLAFAIGMLLNVRPEFFGVQGLVLCPTRELADQVSKVIRKVARFQTNVKVLSLCGGMPFGPQLASLEHGAHIVVGTPGRIQEHLRKGTLRLHHLDTLVLDEADRMLDMGFIDGLRDIVGHTPAKRATWLFSATYPDSIATISSEFQSQPKEIKVASAASRPNIEQWFVSTTKSDKLTALQETFAHFQPSNAIVFCNTKAESQLVADWLDEHKISAAAIHGDLEQKQRDQVLVRFANRSCCVLVATDVAARGIDVDDIDLVVNYDMTRDIDVHTHRIGRTGRAGKKGIAANLYSESEQYKVDQVLSRFDISAQSFQSTTTDLEEYRLLPTMATLAFDAGRKNKLRPGDILGALTAGVGLDKSQVGKIDIFDFHAYVAVEQEVARKTVSKLTSSRIKGKNIKVRKLK